MHYSVPRLTACPEMHVLITSNRMFLSLERLSNCHRDRMGLKVAVVAVVAGVLDNRTGLLDNFSLA
jgi:hypothetical protein